MNECSIYAYSDADEMLDILATEDEAQAIADLHNGYICTVAE